MTDPIRVRGAPQESAAQRGARLRGARVRSRARCVALAGITGILLIVWGLWEWDVILTYPVPLPSTQVDVPVDANTWALAGRDVAHTSAVPIHGGFEGRETWRLETSHPLHAAPAVSGGQVFIGTGDHRFLALDSATGDLIWERRLGLPTSTAPAVTVDAVYVTARDGRLLKLDRRTGAESWMLQADSAFFAPPVVHRGVVYAGSWNGTLYALDAETGRELWTFEAGGSVVASPAFQDDLMVLATDDGLVYVIDLVTGRKRLIFDTVDALTESAVFADSYILVGTGRGRLAAVDWTKLEYPLERALRSWRRQFFIWGLQAEPPLAKGLVWGRTLSRDSALSAPAVLDGTAYITGRDGRLHALSIAGGDQLWEYDAGTLVHTAPAVAGGFVYFGADDGNIHVVDRTTGELAQSIHLGVEPSGRIVATRDALYVTSEEAGVLIALR